ncbi:hypothetical protein SDC9_178806 [bioreactor metagenome]|uniref:Uncharacterized protein n=1 Tax=bioreactor metagenome TaxID=1076179 RepID=A0A645GZ48_9ZZZZ
MVVKKVHFVHIEYVPVSFCEYARFEPFLSVLYCLAYVKGPDDLVLCCGNRKLDHGHLSFHDIQIFGRSALLAH